MNLKAIGQKIAAAWNQFRSASLMEKCDLLAYVCLCAFIFDCSFSGGGHYVTIGSLSPRMIFGFAALLLCVPKLLKNFRKYITNPILLMFVVFLVYLAVCAVRGYRAQYRMNVLISDLKGFMWLFLVPVFIATVTTRERFDRLLTCILVGAVVQAGIVFVVNQVCTVVPNGIAKFYQGFAALQFGTLNNISKRIFRIFMSSCPYMVIACAVALFRQVKAKKLMVRYIAVIALCLCAILLSFTRSVYGCVFVVVACALVALIWFYRKETKKVLKFLAATIAVILCLVFILEFVYNANYLNFAISRTLGIEPKQSVAITLRQNWDSSDLKRWLQGKGTADQDEDVELTEEELLALEEARLKELEQQNLYMSITTESDNLRQVTQAELMELIRQNPVFGNGLGAFAQSRVNGKDPAIDGLDEYFYLDMLARTGIFGLVLYLLPFAYIVLCCFKNRRKLAEFHGGVAMMCGMFGFWAITWFNPWMNAALGITGYALCSALPQILRSES